MQDNDLWAPLIKADEELLWTGRPSTAWHFKRNEWPILVISMCSVAVGVMGLMAADEAPWWFIVFATSIGLLGIALIPFALWTNRSMRARQRYGLSNTRAMIFDAKTRVLRSFPLDETNRLDVSTYGDGHSIVFFKDEVVKIGQWHLASRTPVEIGFEFIQDGPAVRDLLAQHGAGKSGSMTGITRGQQV